MNQDELKDKVAEAALEYINDYDMVIGVGTGSTVNHFINKLSKVKNRIDCCVSSSKASTKLLKSHGFYVRELNDTGPLSLYIDGADECDDHNRLIKGGGAALTREKIVAAASDKFICIIDSSKLVPLLGDFPVPIEVIPMARSFVARELVKIGGQPVLRTNCITDNGNCIIDLRNLKITDPLSLEKQINNIPGVVCNGIFAMNKADTTLIATNNKIIKQ